MTRAISRPLQNANIHRNHKTVGTVGTVGTASNYAGCERSHAYKRSGNSGNTHHFVYIGAPLFSSFCPSLFPQQKVLGTSSHAAGHVNRGVHTVPTVPTGFASQTHMGVSRTVMGSRS